MNKSKNKEIEHCVNLLKQDQLVAIPTETVYGLAGNAFSEQAIELIYKTKNRPPINPLIVHVKNKSVLTEIAQNIPDQALALADRYWPGPLTLILDKRDHISSLITAGKNTVGVRVPNHKLTLELLDALEFPLVAPSANRSNHISPTRPEHVRSSFGENAPYVLDGGVCRSGIESTIVGFQKGEVILYRHGAISKEEIEGFLNCKIFVSNNHLAPESPGMFKKHYAPDTKTLLTRNLAQTIKQYPTENMGVICFQKPLDGLDLSFQRVLSPNGNMDEAASNLYSSLHEMDAMGLDLILMEEVPNSGLGIAINDRLRRASFQ